MTLRNAIPMIRRRIIACLSIELSEELAWKQRMTRRCGSWRTTELLALDEFVRAFAHKLLTFLIQGCSSAIDAVRLDYEEEQSCVS